MSKAVKKYIKKPFESMGTSSDTSANIYMSMLQSKAWKELSAKQQILYLYCKAQYYAEKKKPDGEISFTMNKSKWCDLYGLYTVSNHMGFYKDMAALIDYGFVICTECGAVTRTKSIYKLSDMWQKYGTTFFHILPNQKTMYMRKRDKKLEDKEVEINDKASTNEE